MMIKSIEGKNKTAQANGPASHLSLQHQVLPLPILQHLQRLQGTHNVHWIDSSFLTDLCAPSKINNTTMCFVYMHGGNFVQGNRFMC